MTPDDELRLLYRTFQRCIEDKSTLTRRSAEFTTDGAAYYRVTPGQRAALMAMAPEKIRALNEQERNSQMSREASTGHLYGGTRGVKPGPPPETDSELAGMMDRAGPDTIPGTDDVETVKRQITAVNTWLDSEQHPDYKAQPLANTWRRVTKVCEESGEVWRAHNRILRRRVRRTGRLHGRLARGNHAPDRRRRRGLGLFPRRAGQGRGPGSAGRVSGG
jgi:hypothetical protein